MKTVLRVLLYLLVFLIVVVVGFVSFLEIRGIPKYDVDKIVYANVQVTPERTERGAKIASVQCVICHTGSDGKLSGRLLYEVPKFFGELHSANITQSKDHGIGKWTDAEIVYFLRTGVKPSGQFVPHYMPKFPHMSEEDIASVLSFLHSETPCVQTSEIQTVPCKPSLMTKFLCLVAFKKVPYPAQPVKEPDTTDLVAYGKYLMTGRYDCYPCHSADFKTTNLENPDQSPGYMGGGNTLITQNGNIIYSANITPDETGLGSWTEEDFKGVMREMKRKDGKSIRRPMIPMNQLTDYEIHAMWTYMLTLPKIKNVVNRQWDKEDI